MDLDYHNEFMKYFSKFLIDLHRYTNNDIIGAYVALLDKMNNEKEKVIKQYYNHTNQHRNRIKANDETLFNYPFIVLPHLDLSEVWNQLNDSRKMRVWTYLNTFNSIMDIMDDLEEIVKLNETDEINYYQGIMGSEITEYSINELFNDVEWENEDGERMGLANILKKGSIDVTMLKNALNGLTEDNVKDILSSVESTLNIQLDDRSGAMISNLLNSVTEEINNLDNTQISFKNIPSIAESIATKLQPKLESGEIDVNAFDGGNIGDPMEIFNNLTKNMNDPRMKGIMNMFNNMMDKQNLRK